MAAGRVRLHPRRILWRQRRIMRVLSGQRLLQDVGMAASAGDGRRAGGRTVGVSRGGRVCVCGKLAWEVGVRVGRA